MAKLKFIIIVTVFNYFLNACSFGSETYADSSQNIKQDKTKIGNLLDGNYRYCSKPSSGYESSQYGDHPDSYRWCFDFHKNDSEIVGEYIYWAPWDTPWICIQGTVKNNLVNGKGYELIYGASEPFTEEELIRTRNSLPSSKLFIWDNHKSLQNGKNLKVGSRKVHSLGGANRSYYAWIRYEVAQLNLDKFEKRKTLISNTSQEKSSKTCVPDENNVIEKNK